MRSVCWLAITCTLVAPALHAAQENVMRAPATKAAPVARFISVDALNYAAILPAPPAAGSLAAQVDLETVLQVQAWRTPEEIGWAKTIEADTVFNHASILGAWFKPDRLPHTAVFFKNVGDDLRALEAAAKKVFARPRPSTVDARVQPCVAVAASTSYPSGAALQAFVWAELLGEVFPAKRNELIARAHRAAWGRVIGGAHFPSDVIAGQLLAPAYLADVRKNSRYREAFDAFRVEVIAAAASREDRK